MSSLVYLLVWSPPPDIPYISSPNQCLIFTAHAHTIATCFAVVSILYHLLLVFLSTPYLELCLQKCAVEKEDNVKSRAKNLHTICIWMMTAELLITQYH